MAETPSSLGARPRPHLTNALAAAAWPAAALVWYAHAKGPLRGDTATLLAFIWLLSAGCLGAPVGGLRVLGDRLRSRTLCAGIAAFFTAISALLTYLYATGALHPSLAALTASVLATMAPAVHAYNISRWLSRQEAARQAGVREGRALEAQDCDRREQVVKNLVDGKSAAELHAWIEVLQDVLAGVEAREHTAGRTRPAAAVCRPRLVRSDDDRHAGHG